ncbi:hypothetical protein N825_15085 [Skermanella stibiiresistens SB22]|uniref:Uncharacterized protein n=1 Tax=Skermanella stibiiresistens SB22 TaxID=1385369 RepID=W9GZU0_9PROT|nr:hypothetical protein [Skermanella stibiiresistens]EWY37977.1 hypothetical protein N825_15085 [Skermanella stibiiresistens SB22]
MSDDRSPSQSKISPATLRRQERQAAALRENLRKRKEQARDRRQPEPTSHETAVGTAEGVAGNDADGHA